jgi:hypothetical protein
MERIKWQREKERDLFIYNQILTELNENDLNEFKNYWIEQHKKIDDDYITNNKEKIEKARERQQEMIKHFNERLPGSSIITNEEDTNKGLNVVNCNGINVYFGDGDNYTRRTRDALEYQFKQEMEFIIPKYYNKLINNNIINTIKRKLEKYSDSESDGYTLYCEPDSLSAAPTDSRRMFAWIFIKYIILGWTNSPVRADRSPEVAAPQLPSFHLGRLVQIGIRRCTCRDWPFSSASKPIDLGLGFQVHWVHMQLGFPASALVGTLNG